MATTVRAKKTGRGPVPLLMAQTFAHGMLCAFTIIPGAALFLSAYDARRLPYVYILIAITGIFAAPFFSRALRRYSVASVAIPVLSALSIILTACWATLAITASAWPSVVLEVLFPLTLQIGFVFVGSQASLLLTVREMKERFPSIASGFSLGFLVASLTAPALLRLLGKTDRLLSVTAAAALIYLALVLVTRHRYPGELGTRPLPAKVVDDPTSSFAPRSPEAGASATGPSGTGPSGTGPSTRPLVAALLSYQMLSAFGTQLADYLVYDRAAARYSTSEDLARFVSHFNVALNVVELGFLTLFAGRLFRRFGMRFGMLANPAVVTVFMCLAAASAAGPGAASLAMFFAVGAARVGDITLTNSTTRTAVNTAYQALPESERAAIQARTEGIGVPAAIGASGIVLLAVDRFVDGSSTLVVVAVAALMCMFWNSSGFVAYNRYRSQLRDNLRFRRFTLRPVGPIDRSGRPLLTDETEAKATFLETPTDDSAEAVALASKLQSATAEADIATLSSLADRLRTPEHRPITIQALRASPDALAVLLNEHAKPNAINDSALLTWLVRCVPAHNDETVVRALVPLLTRTPREAGATILGRLNFAMQPQHPDRLSVAEAVLLHDVPYADLVVRALVRLTQDDRVASLRTALLDDGYLLRERALLASGLILDPQTVNRARQWLSSPNERLAAAAIESLEVNVPKSIKSHVVALVQFDRNLDATARLLRHLTTHQSKPPEPDVFRNIVTGDSELSARPWTVACALQSAAAVGHPDSHQFAEAALARWSNPIIVETATWALRGH